MDRAGIRPGMTVADMQSGVSRIRNPVIARVFRELQLVEQWGSGVRRIFAEATAQGLPEPRVTEMATGVRLSVFLAEEISVEPAVSEPKIPPATLPQPEPRLEPRLESRLESPLAARLVVLLQAQESGKAALAQALGHRSVSGELHKQVRRLLEMHFIEMTLPDKPNSRLQRYRLTPQGRALLESTQP